MVRRRTRDLMGPDTRVAIYYCPREDDPLFTAGAAWLGWDPAFAEAVAQPELPGIEEVTAEARVYGFHATLKPPMRLAEGCSWYDLINATRAVASSTKPFELPPLEVRDLHGFLALRETEPCAPLQALADACVVELDALRAPPAEAELARRRRARLTDAQEAMLVRYGYPYVLETWFFHMTLTRRLSEGEHGFWNAETERFFPMAVAPRTVSDVCLFTQSAAGTPFTIAMRFALGKQIDTDVPLV
jgi:putative phosphonate metabolism protein